MNPTLKDIRACVRALKKVEVKPITDNFVGFMSRRALVDLILTYKRPKATKIYRKTAVKTIIDVLLTYKQPKSTRLYRSLS